MAASTLESNTAYHGGAVAVLGASRLFSRGNNVFSKNAAVGGNGGAFQILDDSVVVLKANDAVYENAATLGGGVAYYDATTGAGNGCTASPSSDGEREIDHSLTRRQTTLARPGTRGEEMRGETTSDPLSDR